MKQKVKPAAPSGYAGKIVCIGDSNTYGYDPRSFIGSRYPKDVRWTGRLELRGLEIVNLGVNGLCIPREPSYRMYSSLLADVSRGDIVCIMLGSNDLLQGSSLKVITTHMEEFLRFVRKSMPDGRILLISPPPMQPGEWVSAQELIDRSAKLGEVYSKLADRLGILFADAAGWHVELAYDGVHFSPVGHSTFARRFRDSLAALPEDAPEDTTL